MASITASLPPLMFAQGRKTIFRTIHKLPASSFRERQNHTFVVKASGESSETSTSLSIVKSVQNVWDKSEDRVGLIGLGFAAVVALWTSSNLISAIDSLPIVPSTFELIGVLFSTWFTYRFLLFKPNREELYQIIQKSISDVLGQ